MDIVLDIIAAGAVFYLIMSGCEMTVKMKMANLIRKNIDG